MSSSDEQPAPSLSTTSQETSNLDSKDSRPSISREEMQKIADEAAERSKLRPSPLSSPSQRVGDSITDLLISLNWGIFSTDPVIPSTAKEASLMGLEQAEGVSFTDQVKGNAKLFAGKFTGNDEEVKLGAAK